MLPTKFRVNWHFGSGEEAKNEFQVGCHGGHLGFQIGKILTNFDHPDASYQVSSQIAFWFLREEAKSRFSSWPPWRPSLIFDRNDFSYF